MDVMDSINEHGLLRSSQFLSTFVVLLFGQSQEVQIKLFQDLNQLLQTNSKNKEVFVCSGI